jgi:hypothetical protein
MALALRWKKGTQRNGARAGGSGGKLIVMKRVFLRSDSAVTAAILALASYATANGAGRELADPVYEEVTEGRRRQWEEAHRRGDAWAQKTPYSSCADLIHWILRCLGVRDESLVNRTDDGGDAPWKPTVNIAVLRQSPYTTLRYGRADRPKPSYAVFLQNSSGGHLTLLRSWEEDPTTTYVTGSATTDDYGQPYARRRARRLGRDQDGYLTLDGNPVLWWIDLSTFPRQESACVPDDFEHPDAELDENPYPESGVPA